MKQVLLFSILLFSVSASFSQEKNLSQNNIGKDYFPPAQSWKRQLPGRSGFDTVKLAAAIRFAIANESKGPRNMELSQKQTFGKEPFGEAIGPFADRGDPSGLLIHHGYIIAEWGDPSRVDMTHSVTKSFLSTVIGLAVDRRLIKSTADSMTHYVSAVELYDTVPLVPGLSGRTFFYPFSGSHNRLLTWESMLRQTSDWEGTLWGKPDWADRPDRDSSKWRNRPRNPPGTVWKYNDVRVNALALATAMVWRQPLPQVLKKYIMDPIGASNTWHWYGYRNSWIVLDGKPLQSVSGGGHWGGGMFINSYDLARFGLLTLHKGKWKDKQLISEKWIQQVLTPTNANPGYGYMNFFLNTERKYFPSAPATAFIHIGNGANIIYVDPEHDLVMVVRWIDNKAIDGLLEKVLDAMY